MLVTIISWIYIFFITLSLGMVMNRALSKLIPVPSLTQMGITGYVTTGLVTSAVYAQCFSIFYKVGAICHILMLFFAVVSAFYLRGSLLDALGYLRKIFSRKLRENKVSEQLKLFEERDWQAEIAKLCEKLVEKHELPSNSLYLAKNMGREGKYADNSNKVISYSICIYEPEYPEIKGAEKDPSRNTVITNIKIVELKTKEDRFEVLVRDTATDFVGLIPCMEDKGPVPKT